MDGDEGMSKGRGWRPEWSIAGLGSLPLADPDPAVALIREHFPSIPFWPQLSSRSGWEDILLQFGPGLPCLEIDPEKRRISIDPGADRAAQLTAFYEADLGGDRSRFGLTDQEAPGWSALLRSVEADRTGIERLKGQVVGPVLFCQGVKSIDGRAAIYDPELREALARGLGLKGGWQAERLAPGLEPPLIFVDDPGIYLVGSAHLQLTKEEAREILNMTIGPIREAGAICGVHCCANTDWTIILESEADLVSFDAFLDGPGFTLYADEIHAFLDQGGLLGWGLIPTKGHSGEETPQELVDLLGSRLSELVRAGIPRRLIETQSLLTPACGLGTLTIEGMETVLDLLPRVRALILGGSA